MSVFCQVLLAALLPTASVGEMPDERESSAVLRCREANDALSRAPGRRLFFSLKGQIVAADGKSFFILNDGTDFAKVAVSCDDPFRRGDDAIVRCTAMQYEAYPNLHAEALSIQTVGHADLPAPTVVSPIDLANAENNFHQIELVGIVTDIFRDEVDPSWLVLAIEDNAFRTLAWYRCAVGHDAEIARRLIDARIGLAGICLPYKSGMRRLLGFHLQTSDPANFRIIRPVPEDPFRASGPPGHRQLRTGIVTTVWNERSLFLHETDGETVEASLSKGETAPPPGSHVTIAAFLQSNAFYRRLANALVRVDAHAGTAAQEAPTDVTSGDILRDADGRPRIDAGRHGHLIRIRGRVRDGHSVGTHRAQMLLDCDGDPVTVWIGPSAALPDPGSTVTVTGACVVNVESGIGGRNDVRLGGFSVALRSPGELVIVKSPPWWTPGRLLVILAAMLVLIAAILVWNRSLRILAERRGHELFRSEIGKERAVLRTRERTRLAVELHDTIAQSLTGVTFEINAADRLADTNLEKARIHLSRADKGLKSCRDELRNCIWDLRGSALDQKNMNLAIREALSPHVGNALLNVRFNILRSRLSDSIVHALLRIIRELAVNAVRHGRATAVRIAGSTEGNRLLFSVRDNGCGFDPRTAPGVADGHFGLQGIRERVHRLDGTMRIDSAPGRSSRVTVSIVLPEVNRKIASQDEDNQSSRS